jgi:hypothetical protein
MSAPCFLLDEHIPHAIARGLRNQESAIRVFVMGKPNSPAIGTPDPDLLSWIESHKCLLVTNNRSTMPVHLREHLTAGHHIPGILIIAKHFALRQILDELYLIWGASLLDEFKDRIVYLPLQH